MELPVVVRQALGESAAGVSLRDVSQARDDELLRMVLLTDEEGNLQAICREGDLLDISALNKQLGRDLRVMKRREQVRVRERSGLTELPALPSLTGWPTIVDARVDELASVALVLGEQNLCMVMPGDEFRGITVAADRHSFSVARDTIAVNLN
ncbi:MAG: signal transduction protein, partial [Marinobacter salarius]|nr:signal transduction protein [Marinobacter salarius]